MAGQEWTQNELLALKKEFPIARQGVKDLLSFFPNRTANAIQIKANLLGLKNPYKGRANYYDINFWSNYNKINSYWGGFSVADGCIRQRKDGGYTFSIEIMEDYHLEKFIKDSSGDYKVGKSKIKGGGSQLYYIHYHVGNEWVKDLKSNFNIIPRKTHNMAAPTQIPEEFFPYFLVGFIDGDGCWNLHKKQDILTLSISQATPEILEFINNWINQRYFTVRKKERQVLKSKKGHFSLHIGGKVACELYLDLRKLIPTHHLSRKWDCPEKIQFCEDYLTRINSRYLPKTPILV